MDEKKNVQGNPQGGSVQEPEPNQGQKGNFATDKGNAGGGNFGSSGAGQGAKRPGGSMEDEDENQGSSRSQGGSGSGSSQGGKQAGSSSSTSGTGPGGNPQQKNPQGGRT